MHNEKIQCYIKKTIIVIIADILLSLGIALCIKSDIGTDIYTTLQNGISRCTHLSIGNVILIMNVAVVAVFLFYNRKLIGIGSVVFCFLTGPLVNLFVYILNSVYSCHFVFWVSIVVEVLGVVICSVALATYVQLDVGVQPLDMMIITIKEKTGLTYGISMYIFNIIIFIIAIILKGTIGVGTIINFLLCGKIIDLLTPKLKLLLAKIL